VALAMSPLLEAHGLVKSFGAIRATEDVSLDLRPGEVHAVIGPNGAGKTTLVAQLAGEIAPDAGTIRLLGQDVTRLPVHVRVRRGLVRSFQISSTLLSFTVLENVATAVQARVGHSFRFWAPAAGDPALDGPAMAVLDRLGLAGLAHRPAREIGHGERRVLEIAMALASEPKVLLLDEPMAGVGREETRRLVELLRSLKARYGILLVEHDMDAVFDLADRVTVLVYGRVIASGAPGAIRADPEVRAAYLGDDAEAA
jgi:branched-chain amino acid transport system ATP-binding protein